MKKRPKPEKRQRIPVRTSRARIYYVKPDPSMPHLVRVWLSPTRLHMRATIKFTEGDDGANRWTMGMVLSYTSKVDGRSVVRPGLIIANMFLNGDDLRADSAEIVSHECTHAAMAWVRLRRANLAHMLGEEVLCYAVGRMTREVNRIGFMEKVWR